MTELSREARERARSFRAQTRSGNSAYTTARDVALLEALASALEERDAALAGLADDALQLCDQHISAEVRRETQRRVVERIATLEAASVLGAEKP